MLSGRAAFPGETLSDTLAAVLEREPDFRALPAATPPAIHALLKRCLEHDVKRRFRDIGDVRFEIEDALADRAAAGEAVRPSGSRLATAARLGGRPADGRRDRRRLASGRAPGARHPPRSKPRATSWCRFPRAERLAGLDFPAVAISPDGSLIAYVASRGGGQTELFPRPTNAVDAKTLAGTQNATTPFFSPDNRWIAFFADGQLKKVSTPAGLQSHCVTRRLALEGAGGPGTPLCFRPRPGLPSRRSPRMAADRHR